MNKRLNTLVIDLPSLGISVSATVLEPLPIAELFVIELSELELIKFEPFPLSILELEELLVSLPELEIY